MNEVLAMPKDKNSVSIPLLSFRRGAGAHQITFSGTSSTNTEAIVSSVVSIYATEDCYIEIGPDDSVEASSSTHFIPKQTWLDIDMSDGANDGSYIAVMQVTSGGTLYISERI